MGALTRIMTAGKADGKGSEGSDPSAKPNESLLSDIRRSLGRKKKSGGSSGSSSVPSDDAGPMYHKGGKVRKTGKARLRKGEHVLTGRQYRKMKGRSRSKRR